MRSDPQPRLDALGCVAGACNDAGDRLAEVRLATDPKAAKVAASLLLAAAGDVMRAAEAWEREEGGGR